QTSRPLVVEKCCGPGGGAGRRGPAADSGSSLTIEILNEVLERGAALPPAPLFAARDGEDPLAWVFYTSGTTGTPKGRGYPLGYHRQTQSGPLHFHDGRDGSRGSHCPRGGRHRPLDTWLDEQR